MEIAHNTFSGDFPSIAFFIAAICGFIALFFALVRSSSLRKSKFTAATCCNCSCSSRVGGGGSSELAVENTTETPCLNGGGGGGGEMLERASMVVAAGERQFGGGSMMEQLVPEIRTHALSYLDYPSLCRLSMTNSQMRKAANDDNAWKMLYHKDFTLEQDSVTPVNGWKAYYAATRAIVNTNAEFFSIIRERSLPAMGSMWLNADYVKCIHASGEHFSGYNAVMDSWQHAFNWDVDFQVQDVRARVLTDMAWVTMTTYVEVEAGPFNMSNVFEFHNGRWYMVHHHSSVMLIEGDENQQHMLLG